MKQLALINPENVTETEVQSYRLREAARAVVVDDDNNVALLHVANENYYKLPGGGLEGSEDKILALDRECIEEIGSHIEVKGELGTIVEYRKIYTLKQISYCYIAKLNGPKGTPNLTEKEQSQGFKVVWLPYKEAISTLIKSDATTFEGKHYIVPRDSLLLKEVEIYFKSSNFFS